MRTFTLKSIRAAAHLDEGFCLRCGAQGELGPPSPQQLGLCEECGSWAVMPAATILQVYSMVRTEED